MIDTFQNHNAHAHTHILAIKLQRIYVKNITYNRKNVHDYKRKT